METLDCIFSRRSIRKYTDKHITNEEVDVLIKAASYAPSANNYQPWQFIVISNKNILAALSEVHPYGKMLKNANLAIIVCGDYNIQPIEGYQAVDCSAATQNILLAAHNLGIGSVWLGLFPRTERINAIKNYFKLPENINPITLISLGYPDEIKSQPNRFDKEKTHFNKW